MTLKGILYSILFAFISAYFIFQDDGIRYELWPLFIDYIICLTCIFVLFYLERVPFSLNGILHMFCLFFFGIAPAVQIKHNTVLWARPTRYFENSEYIFTSIVMLFCLIIYNLFYYYKRFKYKAFLAEIQPEQQKTTAFRFNVPGILMLTLVSGFIFAANNGFNIVGMLFRGGMEFLGEKVQSQNDSSLSLIIGNFIRPIPIITWIYFKFKQSDAEKKMIGLEVFLIIISLITNAPTGMARFQAAASYIPILILYIRNIKRPHNFTITFFAGFLIVFPLLNLFRQIDRLMSENSKLFNLDMFNEGHFDAYQNAMDLFSNQIITYGRQLSGVALFYVPRAVWPGKPIGSGSFMADTLGYSFHNIAMNFFAEGYVNFGLVGILLFVLILAFFNAKYDYSFWEGNIKKESYRVFYLVFIGMEFFILRGDMLSSVAFTLGMFCSTLLVSKLISKPSQPKEEKQETV